MSALLLILPDQLSKNNEVLDLAKASDHFNIKALNNKTKKYFISYPKLIDKN